MTRRDRHGDSLLHLAGRRGLTDVAMLLLSMPVFSELLQQALRLIGT